MGKIDDLKNSARELKAKSSSLNDLAKVSKSAADDAAYRLKSEDAKVKAQEKERQARQLEQDARSSDKGILF